MLEEDSTMVPFQTIPKEVVQKVTGVLCAEEAGKRKPAEQTGRRDTRQDPRSPGQSVWLHRNLSAAIQAGGRWKLCQSSD